MLRSDTRSVSINCKPEVVFDYVSDINNWPDYTDFAESVENKGDYWIIHSPQGEVKLTPHFDREKLLLDNTVVVPTGEEVFIPYRVVANGEGSELMMTNFQASSDSDADYAEQLGWMEEELESIKRILEKKHV